MHRHRPLQGTPLKHRYRQPIADTHEIAKIDQQIDARKSPFFGQAAQKGFRGAPILCWVYPELTKRPPPGRQGLDLAQGSVANALQNLLLFGLVESLQTCRCWAVHHIPCQDSSTNDLWVSRQNVRVILKNRHFCLHFSQDFFSYQPFRHILQYPQRMIPYGRKRSRKPRSPHTSLIVAGGSRFLTMDCWLPICSISSLGRFS